MSRTIDNSLYVKDRQAFVRLQRKATQFSAAYCGRNIIQDDIFNVVENYSRQFGLPFELLRYGVDDTEFCACTFIREGCVFSLINNSRPLSRQIFAAAHELYHIVRYCEEGELRLRTSGSILLSETMDEDAAEKEEMEANAFAGLVLAPGDQILEQIRIYGLKGKETDLRSIIMLMDIFAVPFKAMVLRLFEEGIATEVEVRKLFQISSRKIEDEIDLTGRAKRWQTAPQHTDKYGSLLENMNYLEQIEAIRTERIEADRQKLKDILAGRNDQ